MASVTGVSHEVRNLDLAAPAPQMSLDRALPKSLPGAQPGALFRFQLGLR